MKITQKNTVFSHLVLWMLILASATACMKNEINFDALRVKADYSLETAYDVEILYSDSAKVKVRVTGPVCKRYIYRFKTEDEFPEGVKVEFFDNAGTSTGWLIAKYGLRKSSEKQVVVRDSVVLYNFKGERLTTTELIWDEREKLIYTDRFVKITRPDEVILSHGFRTTEGFDWYELDVVQGEIGVEDQEKTEENE